MNSIHSSVAAKVIEAGQPCQLKVWRTSKNGRGEIIEYNNAICIAHHLRSGNFRIKLLNSNQIREFNIFFLFELNQMEVYL